jgi:hypothetical protein
MSNQAATLTVAVPSQPTQPLATQQPDSAEFYSRIGTSLEAVKELGSWIARSGVFNCQKDEQGNMIALECLATRKTPFDFKREFHLVNGSLTMRSDAMLAGYRTRGGKVIWKQFDSTAAIGIWKYDGNECEIGFTTEDAKIAGLLPAKPGSGWAKDPSAMLRARCISKAIRMLAPEVVAGVYTPEEAADFATSSAAPAPTSPTRQTVNVTPESSFSLVEKLEQILEPHSESANAFLVSKSLIKEGQNFRDVSTKVANMIIADQDGFLLKANAYSNPPTE